MGSLRGWTAILAVCTATFGASGIAGADNYEVMHAFRGGKDGALPQAGLVAGSDGTLYGTALVNLGPGKNCSKNCGQTYGFSPSGKIVILHRFESGRDGKQPDSPLIIFNDRVYGTTSEGGRSQCDGGPCGTVYDIALDGTKKEKILYRFCTLNNCADGNGPVGGVIADGAGNLYGLTGLGGVKNCPYGFPGCGVVYKLAPDGTESILYAFCSQEGCTDGRLPGIGGGLVMDKSGNLYGSTDAGGDFDSGAVFQLTSDGTETVLYSFCTQLNCTDGDGPLNGLIMDSNANLYGVTGQGGSDCNCGVVFKLSSIGNLTVLHTFQGGSDGEFPQTGLTMDDKGNLFGTTIGGGGKTGCGLSDECGTVFKIAPDGTETILHAFCSRASCSDGYYPQGILVIEGDYLYGTTTYGGNVNCLAPQGCGTIFRMRK